MKTFSFLLIVTVSISCFSQSPTAGRLKISIENVRCINKSWDGFVEFDGHGSEVSVTYSYRIYNPSNPSAARSGMDGTVIFGSNVNGMTRAGTQTPDLGGINNGDVVNIFKPIMDEHINADEYIIIAPTVWEWDGPEKNTINSFNSQLETDLNFAINQSFPFANTPVSFTNPFADRVFKNFNKYPGYGQALKYHNIFKNFFCPGNTQGNRVIGISSGTFNNECLVTYPPTLLALDTRVLYALYANNKSSMSTGNSHAEKEAKGNFIPGVTIPFTENTYAVTTSNGSYTVFLRIEFIPDYVSPTPSTELTGTPTKNTAKKAVGNRSISILNTALYLPGTWTGTYGYGESNTPNNYGMTFNADGTMQVIDQFGVVQARGTYVFTQASRNITAAYTYLVGDAFDFNGTMTDNVINGQWWRRNDKNHGGKMVLYKK